MTPPTGLRNKSEPSIPDQDSWPSEGVWADQRRGHTSLGVAFRRLQRDSSDLLSATSNVRVASGRRRARGYNQGGGKVLNKDAGPQTAASTARLLLPSVPVQRAKIDPGVFPQPSP